VVTFFEGLTVKLIPQILLFTSSECQLSCKCRYNNKKQFVVLIKYVHAVNSVVCSSDAAAEKIPF